MKYFLSPSKIYCFLLVLWGIVGECLKILTEKGYNIP